MSEISIVTAFYDIGRSEWTEDRGLPHYLHRTTDTYFERFSHMASLDNEMVIFTSEDLVERVKQIRGAVSYTYIADIIANNDVHITGPCIVAGKQMWPKLESLVDHSLKELLKNDLIDDDQTVLLMSYLLEPDLFELHKVSDTDWFVAFKDYSE